MGEPALKERPEEAVTTTAARLRPGYEDDYYAWVIEQVVLLRTGQLSVLDAENIAEELEGLARSEFSKLRSALRILVIHMLKWDQQSEHRTRSWMHSIREQRRRYHDVIRDNPSLLRRRDEALRRAYPSARDWAANETHLPEDEFPDTCPYTWDDILERPFEAEPAPE